MTLKIRFLEAVYGGDLGEVDDSGVIVSLKDFKSYFEDVKSDYVNSFLPAAVIEAGQKSATHTKFLFRVRKGVYRVHPDAMDAHIPDQPVKAEPVVNRPVVNRPVVKKPALSDIALRDLAINSSAATQNTQPVASLDSVKKVDESAFPVIDSKETKPRKKPDLNKMPASQMNNKVEEAMMQYMTYRLN